MAYRYTASGSLMVSPRHVETVCSILSSCAIIHERDGNTVHIKHDEKTATTTPRHPSEEAFEQVAPYIEEPQALTVFSELMGESEVGFVNGHVRSTATETVWSLEGEAPTPDVLVDALRRRGIAARLHRTNGRRSRRQRVFEIQPGSGGPGCRITIKRRFWDSYDLLAVPDVYESLCRKYHLTPRQLRQELKSAKFGVEVRSPALGGPSADMLFENLLEIVEETTEGIRTDLG